MSSGRSAVLAGSDSLLLVPELAGAVTVSVGVEPNGVPPRVINLGGGPARFRELLADQLRRREHRDVPDLDVTPGWNLSFRGITHERERTVEALLTLADGTIGTSGAPLFAHASATPTVVASGVYRGTSSDADLLDLPCWERLHIEGPADAHLARVLDLRTGVLAERTHDGRGLSSVRFSSLARPGTAVLRVTGGSVGIPADQPLLAPADDIVTIEHTEGGRYGGEAEWTVIPADSGAVTVAAVQDLDEDGHLDRVAIYHPVEDAASSQDALARLADARRRRVRHTPDRAPAGVGRPLGCRRYPARRR